MRAALGIVSLLVVLAVVALLNRQQLKPLETRPNAAASAAAAAAVALPAAKPGASPQQQSEQIQNQVKQSLEAAMQQTRTLPDEK